MTIATLTRPWEPMSYGFLDASAKRELRRKMLKAIAVPGCQMPYASREVPMARGWGTGGLQVTLTLLKPASVVKVIDQGADDSVNAASIRSFLSKVSGAIGNMGHHRGDPDPEPPSHPGRTPARRSGAGATGAEPRTLAAGRAEHVCRPPDACRCRLRAALADPIRTDRAVGSGHAGGGLSVAGQRPTCDHVHPPSRAGTCQSCTWRSI